MSDRIRQLAMRLKDKIYAQYYNSTNMEKVDRMIHKYTPATQISKLAGKIKNDAIGTKVKELVTRYEKFTGVEEIMAIQNSVIDAQERFVAAQDHRRELGRQLADLEERLKELHAEMQNTMKGDEKYLQLCNAEHKLIIQERSLRAHFAAAEAEERDLFARMSGAVKLGHERERAHAERNKYWYIVASIFGTVLGIAGSTINNRLKMAEFREMLEQQMARSASVLYTVAGGAGASRADITDAMNTEFAYQEQLAKNLALMQENINHLVSKQSNLIEHLSRAERILNAEMRELKRLVVTASQSSAESDAELAKVLNVVHKDLDDDKRELVEVQNKVVLDSNQVLTGVGVIMCAAILLGSLMGRN